MNIEKYYELNDDVIKFFYSCFNEFNIPLDLKFTFLGDNTQKQLIKMIKIPPQYAKLLNKDILVIINEYMYDLFNENDNSNEINKILFDQQIDLIEYNLEKGTFKISKPSINLTNHSIKKYSFEKVKNAIELEKIILNKTKNEQK